MHSYKALENSDEMRRIPFKSNFRILNPRPKRAPVVLEVLLDKFVDQGILARQLWALDLCKLNRDLFWLSEGFTGVQGLCC